MLTFRALALRQSRGFCSDEGLTLETSAFQSLYGGQFTLSTPLINQILVFEEFVLSSLIALPLIKPLFTPDGWPEVKCVY